MTSNIASATTGQSSIITDANSITRGALVFLVKLPIYRLNQQLDLPKNCQAGMPFDTPAFQYCR
jgi:hypothetical protein